MVGRGFASMSRERLMEVSSKGGRNVPAAKRGFTDRTLAQKAGKIGGKRLVQRGLAKEKANVPVE